jgi:RNA polymerase sigma factor (sigma-70 family)
MKKYNVQNYVRYKNDLDQALKRNDRFEKEEPDHVMSLDNYIVSWLPLVENLARKFSTSDQAAGVMSINDLIQEGAYGLTAAVKKINWDKINDSDDPEKTLKSFLSKRIKGAIRRGIDINRGDVRIPEHKLNEIRNNPENEALVAMFFNSVFSSIDEPTGDDENPFIQVPDNSEPYNTDLLNAYLLTLMRQHLTNQQYDVLRLSYGLDQDHKWAAADIAKHLNINVATANVRISQIKKEAIDTLIANTDSSQVLDFL